MSDGPPLKRTTFGGREMCRGRSGAQATCCLDIRALEVERRAVDRGSTFQLAWAPRSGFVRFPM